MGHSNIYIRKENEATWNKIADKSAWVNSMLENDVILEPKVIIVDSKESNKQLEKAGSKAKQCEHGYGARLCLDKKCGHYQFRKG